MELIYLLYLSYIISQKTNEMSVEEFKQAGKIMIRPYCNPKKENMGLEDHGYVVFPGTSQRESIACVEHNGKQRYLNGLDENAPEIKMMPEGPDKEAKIKKIRTIIAELEEVKNYNKISIEDPEFWNKVKMFRADNKDTWSKLSLTLENKNISLNPIDNTDDLLVIYAIESGGFPMIAKSLEDNKNLPVPKKWYLDKQIESAGIQVSIGKIKNKALALLNKLSEKEAKRLFYVAKLVDVNSMQYTNRTLADVIYNNMDMFINGEGNEPKIEVAANMFIGYAAMSIEELKIRCLIKDATFYKFIIQKHDGILYTHPDGAMLGKTSADVYEYLQNPLNQDVLSKLMEKVEANW